MEFDRQVQNLFDKGYPEISGLGADRFAALVAPLRDLAARHPAPPTEARVPFVLVVTQVPPGQTMPLTALKPGGKPGFADFDADDIARFTPIKELEVPESRAYLLLDVERGEEFCNVTPDEAMLTITERGRTPLTVDEGIALITQFPTSLAKNKCFSLSGSRCGDRRVPALWISAGAPKLGWCWAGNPHTWLGSASCAGRAWPGRADPGRA